MLRTRRIFFLFLLPLIVAVLAGTAASAADNQIDVIEVKGTINPVTADYIERGISKAEEDGAVASIIILNTPGGLLSSTEEIVERIMGANVPVVVYVDPWAGSAGTFITLAAHIAAMAPASRIGAASPISGSGEEISETLKEKITQDTAAWIESIADERSRNKLAAIAAVAEAASYTDQEALGLDEIEGWEELGLDSPILDPPLVDLGVDNFPQLIEKIDGMEVTLQSGEVVKLQTKDAAINYIGMTTMERFLLAITDPNIAFILLSIAMLGILIELSNPGLIFPGVVGGISLLLSIYSLGILEANYTGLILMFLAFGLFIAEVFTSSFGLLFAGGVVSLILGSLILFSGTALKIDAWVIATVVIIFSAIFAFIIGAIIRAHRRQVTTGKEGMLGRLAVAQTAIDPSGTVFIEGSLWTATTEGDRIEPGEDVIVIKVDRLKLKVAKK
jgi:membrane-bound serine protease (ClpP class)